MSGDTRPKSGGGEDSRLTWRQRLLENWRGDAPPFFYLKPLGWLYGLGASLRRRVLPSLSPPSIAGLPVISFGNLTVGGSGKTPMSLALARLLIDNGYRPAVLSRGYGRTPSLRPASVVVSRGEGPIVSVEESGDEPWMMASELPGLTVIVDVDRVQGAEKAKELGADIIILDDGFQQLRLEVNRRILLIPADKPFGNKAVLPAGPLRENLSAHRFADLLVATGAAEPTAEVLELAQERPVFAAEYKPIGWRSLRERYRKPIEFMAGRKVMAFCGLGRPDGFLRTLEKLGLDIRRFIDFDDHQVYDRPVLNEIGFHLMDSGAEVLVTTAKDAVKIPPDFPLPLMYLQMQMEINRPDDFFKAVMEGIEAANQAGKPPWAH